MTQEEKELLLKDLCARFPYGVKVQTPNFETPQLFQSIEDYNNIYINSYSKPVTIEEIKPYLRPMSSMTDEEKVEIQDLYHQNTQEVFKDPSEIRGYRFYDISVVDWLNAHHFDYRGLIPMSLALEALEGMYKID